MDRLVERPKPPGIELRYSTLGFYVTQVQQIVKVSYVRTISMDD